jgi:hypothetical protein
MLALVSAVLVGFTGCISRDSYPDTWPPGVVSAAECPDISGIFENDGSASGNVLFCPGGCTDKADYAHCADECSDALVQLSEIFLAEVLPDNSKVAFRQLDEDKTEVRIEGPDASYSVRQLSHNDNDFMCNEGKFWVSLDEEIEVDIGGVAFSSRKIGFSRAMDGSLIGEFHHKGRGVILVAIPAGWSERRFIRWRAINRAL